MQPHCCDIASLLWHSHIVVGERMLWGILILVRQPHYWEAASLWRGSINVLRHPYYCEAASKLWGSLKVVRQPHWCEVSSLLWGNINFWSVKIDVILRILRLTDKASSIEATSYSLKHWGYLIETTSWRLLYLLVKFSQHLACEFHLSWFLNLLILVPQARLPCLQLFTTLHPHRNSSEGCRPSRRLRINMQAYLRLRNWSPNPSQP